MPALTEGESPILLPRTTANNYALQFAWGTFVGVIQIVFMITLVNSASSSSSLAQKPSNTISTSTSQEEGDILGQLSVLSPDVATMDVDNPSPQLADGGSVASRSPSSDTAHHTSNSNSLRNRGSDASPQEGARPVDKDKPLVRVKEEPTVIQLHDVQPTTTLVRILPFSFLKFLIFFSTV